MGIFADFRADNAFLPPSNFATPSKSNSQPVLLFDAATNESAYFGKEAPDGMSGALSAKITYRMASATTGTVVFNVYVQAVADGDAVNLNSGFSFDTANSGSDAVPGTAGYPASFTITLTNDDGAVAGDDLVIQVERNASSGSDTAAGDCQLVSVVLFDGG